MSKINIILKTTDIILLFVFIRVLIREYSSKKKVVEMKRIISTILLFVPLLIFAEEGIVGYLGISGRGLNEAMKTALGVENGTLVEKVFEDTPAEKADIKVGDVILKIDKQKITTFSILRDIVEERPNKKVDIVVFRSGKSLIMKVELGQREKKRKNIDIDIPAIYELKEFLEQYTPKLQEELDKLKEDIEKLKENLKEEIEELKKQIK